MRVLVDECLPGRKLKAALRGHEVRTVAEMNWRGLKNGALLRKAQPEFDAFITIDGNLQYQQNTPAVDLLVIILRARSNRIEHLLPLMAEVVEVLARGESRQVISIGS